MKFSYLSTLVLATASTSMAATAPPTIPELAVSAGRFNTLVAAVGAADLGGALSSEGPFTVFAPTDAAFAKIDKDTIAFLLTDAGKPQLQRILKNHGVAGRLDAATLVGQSEVETLAGTTLPLQAARGRLFVGDAVVESADLIASNGVIHVIDRVLLPPKLTSPREQLITVTVERGVPLFNDGSPEACCAVYATALDAMRYGEGFGLDANGRKALGTRIDKASTVADPRERAWEYRRLIDALWSEDGVMSNAQPVAVQGKGVVRTLFSFDNSQEVRQWGTVLDGVMGGRSTGRISEGQGSLIFEGSTSLQNNGGFSSMRVAVPNDAFEGADAIRIRVKGDGRTYILGTRGSGNMGGDAFWTRFDTRAGEWMEITVPIEEMERHYFGRKLEGTMTPDKIKGLDFYIYDKNSGPFRLEVDTIEAVNTGSRNVAFDA